METDQGHVEVLCCDTDQLAIPDGKIDAILSEQELARGGRFRLPELSRRYRAGRYLLRNALARQMDMSACAVRFVYGEMGKPYVAGGPAFNLSDSQSMVLIALAAGGNIGIDVEHVIDSPDLDGISQRYFSEEERTALGRLPIKERVRGFYRVWTRKEAIIKALGAGLSIPLDSFVVSVAEHEGNALLRGDGDVTPERWFIQSIVVGREYEAAVAWDRYPSSVGIRHFLESERASH